MECEKEVGVAVIVVVVVVVVLVVVELIVDYDEDGNMILFEWLCDNSCGEVNWSGDGVWRLDAREIYGSFSIIEWITDFVGVEIGRFDVESVVEVEVEVVGWDCNMLLLLLLLLQMMLELFEEFSKRSTAYTTALKMNP